MSTNVVDIHTRQPFDLAEPEMDEPAPQPPDGLTEEQQQIWWDGWTACHERQERKAAATVADASRFIQRRQVALGLRQSGTVS